MNIKFDMEKKISFDELEVGDTFVDIRYDRELWVVVAPEIDIILEEDSTFADDDCKYWGYAVNLHNGKVNGFYRDEEVIEVDCDVKVKSI